MFSFFKKSSPKTPERMIYPRIKNRNFLTALEPVRERSPESVPVCTQISEELFLTFALDDGKQYFSLSPALLDKYGITEDQMWREGLDNGLDAIRNAELIEADEVWQVFLPDMAACTILYPDFWHRVSLKMGGPVAFNVTHKNLVLCARKDNPEHMGALISTIKEVGFDDTHSLAPGLYTYDGEGLVQLELEAAP